MKTVIAKVNDVEHKWYLVDATDQILGRLSSKVAQILRGKHKPMYSPHQDLGDHVIIINADKVRVSGKKAEQKRYYHHTGYPGTLKSAAYEDVMKEKPLWILEHAIKGMLPHNRLGRKMFKKLKVYIGDQHPHQAQQPVALDIN